MPWSWTVKLLVFSKVFLRARYQIFHCSCGRNVTCAMCAARPWGLISVTVCLCLHLLLIPRSSQSAAVALHNCGKLWNTAAMWCSSPVGPEHTPGEIQVNLFPFAAREMMRQSSPVVTLQCSGMIWNRRACPILFIEVWLLNTVSFFILSFTHCPQWVMVPFTFSFLIIFWTVVLKTGQKLPSISGFDVSTSCGLWTLPVRNNKDGSRALESSVSRDSLGSRQIDR